MISGPLKGHLWYLQPNSPLMTAAEPARITDSPSYLPNVPKLSSLVYCTLNVHDFVGAVGFVILNVQQKDGLTDSVVRSCNLFVLGFKSSNQSDYTFGFFRAP